MDPMRNIVFILFILIAVVVIVLICIYYIIKRSTAPKDIPDTSWQEPPSFRDGIKSSGLNPEKVISYGKTCFTYDDNDIFIQTGKTPGGMKINSGDVVSFELCRDGKAIEPVAVSPEFDLIEPQHIEISCFDLHVTVKLKDGSEIILPLIDTPTQYEYVYRRALDVAYEIAAVLRDIIDKRRQ